MTRLLRDLVMPAVLGALVMAAPAQAAIIPVVLQFTDADWSGVVSFDDTTGVPWSSDPALTAYAIADMTISDGIHTWTEDELDDNVKLPPDFGWLVDANGQAAVLFFAFDTASGAELGTGLETSNSLFGRRFLITEGGSVVADYTAFIAAVPFPGSILLVASGLAALAGVVQARRRR